MIGSHLLNLASAVVLAFVYVTAPVCDGHLPVERGRALLGRADWQFDSEKDASSVSCAGGHYPPVFCTAYNLALNHKTKVFTVYSEDADMSSPNAFLFRMAAEPRANLPHCDQTVDEAYLFTFYFYYGHSNYFHLHYDTLFPIYSLLRARQDSPQSGASSRPVVMMPVVEKQRMTSIDWDSGAFDDKFMDKYFILILNALAGDHPILPLDSNLVENHPAGFTCFRKASFGVSAI